MSLTGKTIWVIGGVGTVGRGITRGLLQAGATVIVNSRKKDRLDRIQEELEKPDRLIAIHGSLKPDFAPDTVQEALKNRYLDHVVAHGAVRYWTPPHICSTSQDETYSLKTDKIPLFEYSSAEFAASSSALASFHYAAAQALLPRIIDGNYVFVTGDGMGHPSSRQTPMGELNAHHVRGLAAAMRLQLQTDPNVTVQELRVGLAVPQAMSVSAIEVDGKLRPISEEIGALVAGIIAKSSNDINSTSSRNELDVPIQINDEAKLDQLLEEYQTEKDPSMADLPSICDFAVTRPTI